MKTKGVLLMANEQVKRDTELRNSVTAQLKELLSPLFEDLGNDKDNVLSFPTLDSARNERCITITVSVPKGSRDGVDYDCFEAHAEYERKKAEAKAKADKVAKAKAEKIAKDEERRKARAEAKAKAQNTTV